MPLQTAVAPERAGAGVPVPSPPRGFGEHVGGMSQRELGEKAA